VILFTTTWFPPEHAEKAGKTYLEVMKKYPRDRSISKVLLDSSVSATKNGYKVVSASEVKEGKLVEAIDLANKRLIMFAEEIEGYKYKIEVLSTITEALGVLGLKPPE